VRSGTGSGRPEPDVNYYEHHIRDYDAATAHLSWDEDMAYARLLRWYYRKESGRSRRMFPRPADSMRATTKAAAQAVESVLREFFELREDGWHKDVCDEAIDGSRPANPSVLQSSKNEDTTDFLVIEPRAPFVRSKSTLPASPPLQRTNL
jgi:uncharacterized protein YdaU (DUF1376 family)